MLILTYIRNIYINIKIRSINCITRYSESKWKYRCFVVMEWRSHLIIFTLHSIFSTSAVFSADTSVTQILVRYEDLSEHIF